MPKLMVRIRLVERWPLVGGDTSILAWPCLQFETLPLVGDTIECDADQVVDRFEPSQFWRIAGTVVARSLRQEGGVWTWNLVVLKGEAQAIPA